MEKNRFAACRLAEGACVIFAPTIVTGQGYSDTNVGSYQAGDLILRSGALILGLRVIYDAGKTCLKE